MIVFTQGKLIDGIGGNLRRESTIVVEEGRIIEVGKQVDIPEDTKVVNLKGMIVLPGLIDSHVHLGGIQLDDAREISKLSSSLFFSSFQDYQNDYAYRRKLALEYGVTTIRSAGDIYPYIIELQHKINSGNLAHPGL